jgi:hypothetical protein
MQNELNEKEGRVYKEEQGHVLDLTGRGVESGPQEEKTQQRKLPEKRGRGRPPKRLASVSQVMQLQCLSSLPSPGPFLNNLYVPQHLLLPGIDLQWTCDRIISMGDSQALTQNLGIDQCIPIPLASKRKPR